jgi:hypothetical protein
VVRELNEQRREASSVAAQGKGLDLTPEQLRRLARGDLAAVFASQEALDEFLRAVVGFMTADEARRMRREAARVLMSLPPGASALQKAEAVANGLSRLSPEALQSVVEKAANRAYTQGREVGAVEYEQGGGVIERAMYSAIRDTNTCAECFGKDRTYHEPFDPAYQTPNPNCEGGELCRCLTIFETRGGR